MWCTLVYELMPKASWDLSELERVSLPRRPAHLGDIGGLLHGLLQIGGSRESMDAWASVIGLTRIQVNTFEHRLGFLGKLDIQLV
jgi:hypothetical protein